MKRSIRFLSGLLLVAVFVLAACALRPTPTMGPRPAIEQSGTATVEPPVEIGGRITLWHSLQEEEITGLNIAIQAFQADNPNVQFDVLFVPQEDLRGRFEIAAATNSGPTVVIGPADWGPAFYDAGLASDLGDLASQELLEGINQAALDSLRYRDVLVGLPYLLQGVVMYRNTSIIPEVPATYDDLLAAAQSAAQGQMVGAFLERGPYFAFGHLHGVGGQLLTPDGDPAFNDQSGIDWLNLTNSFEDAGPTAFNNDNDINLFKEGNVGIVIDGTWNLADLAEAIGEEKLVIDPWPAPLSGYVQNNSLYLSAHVEGGDRDASWAFMAFLLTAEAQALLAENNSGFIPAALDVEASDRLRQEAMVALEGGVNFPVIPEMNAYWGPMETAMRSVFDQDVNPADALAQAADIINTEVAKIRGDGSSAPQLSGTVTLWHSLREEEFIALNAAIEDFQEASPRVQFDVLFVPQEDLRGKFESAAAAGGGPSMMIATAAWGPALYDSELVADLNEFAGTEFLSTINAAALKSVQYQDALIGLPYVLRGAVMYRNTSIIAEAPQTYDDLVVAARSATQSEVVGAYLERGPYFAFGHLDGVGGQLMTMEGDPAFNDVSGVEWLNLMKSFENAGATTFDDDEDINRFKAGNAGVVIDGTWNLAAFVEAIGEDGLAIDPWPTPLSGYLESDDLYMNFNVAGDDRDATWAFMQFLLLPEGQAILAQEDQGFIPSVNGVNIPDRLRTEAMVAFEGGVHLPVIPEIDAFWGPMETAMRSVFQDDADPAAALQTAFNAVTAAVARIREE
jgi:arabinogalactan oligomer/maltooligosaccharide transport system substrate-binding protein